MIIKYYPKSCHIRTTSYFSPLRDGCEILRVYYFTYLFFVKIKVLDPSPEKCHEDHYVINELWNSEVQKIIKFLFFKYIAVEILTSYNL
jgi:hypothetical protein